MNFQSTRTLTLILSALILLLTFSCVACGTDQAPPDDVTTLPETEEAVSITVADLVKYKIVRPSEAPDSLVAECSALYNRMREVYGDNAPGIRDDFYRDGVAALAVGEYEILIGQTNRPESEQFLADMRSDDYGYAVIGKKIVIAGKTVDATFVAIDKFVSEIVNKYDAASDFFYSSDKNLLVRGEYDIDELRVGGNAISSYSIVYPKKGSDSEQIIAENLAATISQMTGYILDVNPDGTAADEYEILIGRTDRDTAETDAARVAVNGRELAADESFVAYNGKTIRLYGADSAAMIDAVKSFIALIGSSSEKTVNITPPAASVHKFDKTALTAMSFNVLVSNNTADRQDRVIQMIKNYLPDTVGCQEASPTWMSVIKSRLGDTYGIIGEGREGGSNGEYNPILYKKSMFNLIESGTRWLSATPERPSRYEESSLNRIYTYAMLERKSDGVHILIINTHLEHTSEAARELQAKVLVKFIADNPGYPIILTGDFNAVSSSKAYATVISSGVTDSFKTAKEGEATATFTNYGKANAIIDFVFITPMSISVNKYKVCNEMINGDYPSDHHPVLIEYYVMK